MNRSFIFLHGLLGEKADWQPIMEVLAPHEVTALDLPFHGHSKQDLAQFFTELKDLIQSKTNPVLVGYSLGGRLALEFLVTHKLSLPLVLIASHPGLVDEKERGARLQLDRERAQQILHDREGFIRSWYNSDLFGGLIHKSEHRFLIERRLLSRAPWHLAITAFSPGKMPARFDELCLMGHNICYFYGARDNKYATLASTLASKGIKTHSLADAHHMAHLETDPLSFARALLQNLP